MNIHLSQFDVMKLICEKFNIAYDEVKDPDNAVVDFIVKDPNILITFEGLTYMSDKG